MYFAEPWFIPYTPYRKNPTLNESLLIFAPIWVLCWNGFGVIFGSEKHANNCRCSFHLPKTEVYRPDIVCLHCQFGVFLGGESLTKAGDLSHVLLIARRFSRQKTHVTCSFFGERSPRPSKTPNLVGSWHPKVPKREPAVHMFYGVMLLEGSVAKSWHSSSEAKGMIPGGVENYGQMPWCHSLRKADHAAGFTSLNSAVAQGTLRPNSHILWAAGWPIAWDMNSKYVPVDGVLHVVQSKAVSRKPL